MTPYTETAPYVALVKRFDADIEKVTVELNELNAFLKTVKPKRRKESPNPGIEAMRKRRGNLRAKLKTRTNKLARLNDFKVPLWYLVEFLSAAHGELWTPEQAETWKQELKAHEGRGEKALRMRYGLSLVPSTDDCDIILPCGKRIEVKNLDGRSKEKGTWIIQDIQTGKSGRKVYSRWMAQQAEAGRFKGLSENVRDALFTGELSRGTIYGVLPKDLYSELMELLRPHNVLGSYDLLVGTTRFGSVTIPKADFDAAWVLEVVTKMGPKYALRKGYVVNRLKQTLVSAVQVAV